MCPIENESGVHSKEVSQVDRTKTKSEQYSEFCKLDSDLCDGDKIIEIKNKTRILQE